MLRKVLGVLIASIVIGMGLTCITFTLSNAQEESGNAAERIISNRYVVGPFTGWGGSARVNHFAHHISQLDVRVRASSYLYWRIISDGRGGRICCNRPGQGIRIQIQAPTRYSIGFSGAEDLYQRGNRASRNIMQASFAIPSHNNPQRPIKYLNNTTIRGHGNSDHWIYLGVTLPPGLPSDWYADPGGFTISVLSIDAPDGIDDPGTDIIQTQPSAPGEDIPASQFTIAEIIGAPTQEILNEVNSVLTEIGRN